MNRSFLLFSCSFFVENDILYKEKKKMNKSIEMERIVYYQLDWSIRYNYYIHVQSVVVDEFWEKLDDFRHVLVL